MHLVSENSDDTRAIAAKLAKRLVASMPGSNATIIALEGDLGAGKTTFAQGFAAALGIPETPKSPTFNLAKQYAVPHTTYHLWHIDCYRLEGHKDAQALDLHTLFNDPNNLMLIEWAERLGDALPRDHVRVAFAHHGGDKRAITLPQ